MKKWLLRSALVVGLLTLTLGILYECATHVGRGWLRGAAFYQDRPTSYWRSAIEAWEDRFESAEAAQRYLRLQTGSTILLFQSPRPTVWARTRSWVGLETANDDEPPAILGAGYLRGPEGEPEPVLAELEADPAMRPYVAHARRQIQLQTDFELQLLPLRCTREPDK
jgi:hypothetical protein